MASRGSVCLTDKVLRYFSRTGHTLSQRQALGVLHSELLTIRIANEDLGYLRGREGIYILDG